MKTTKLETLERINVILAMALVIILATICVLFLVVLAYSEEQIIAKEQIITMDDGYKIYCYTNNDTIIDRICYDESYSIIQQRWNETLDDL